MIRFFTSYHNRNVFEFLSSYDWFLTHFRNDWRCFFVGIPSSPVKLSFYCWVFTHHFGLRYYHIRRVVFHRSINQVVFLYWHVFFVLFLFMFTYWYAFQKIEIRFWSKVDHLTEYFFQIDYKRRENVLG